MIRGYFRSVGSVRRPYVDGLIDVPAFDITGMEIRFVVDTGADRTLVGHRYALHMVRLYDADLTRLPMGPSSRGIGGVATTRVVRAVLAFEGFSTDIELPMLEPTDGQPIGIPSLLGRDVLSHFGLFMEERTNRVLLLEPHEVDRLELE